MADDIGTAMGLAGNGMMIAGAGLVSYSVVNSAIPVDTVGIPASAAMIGGLGLAGMGAAFSIVSKSL